MRSSNRYSRPAGDMGLTSEVKRSSRPQETSKVVKQRILSPQAIRSPKSLDKHNIGTPIGQYYLNENHEKNWRAGDVLISLPKTSKNSQKSSIGCKANKNDELVKHMSNLPGYLQRVEKGENLQEKALHFGVLDWGRLEKWKHKKPPQPSGNANASSSAGRSSYKVDGLLSHSSTKSLAPHKKQLNPSQGEGFSHDVKQYLRQEDFKAASRNMLDGQQNLPRISKSSDISRFERGKRENSGQKIRSKKGTTLSDLRKHESSRSPKVETISQISVASKKEVELQKRHGERGSFVLLLPRHTPTESCSASVQTSEPGKSFDAKQMGAYQGSSSDGFSSEGVHHTEQDSGILHSCPLPIGVKRSTVETPTKLSHGEWINKNASRMQPSGENGIDASKKLDHETTTEPVAVKGRHSSPNRRFSFSLGRISKSLSFKESSNVPQLSSTFTNGKSCSLDSCPLPVGIETNSESDLRRHRLTSSLSMELSHDETPQIPSREDSINISKRSDPETTEAVKGRHPSPNRRLNFGLGRLSRSFSFKEGSTVPKLSSTYTTVKSGPVSSEAYDSLNNANRNNNSIHNRARSSPLRRLLDPLLKVRATNPHHSAEINHPLTGNSVTSTIQAFLQLKIKNGLPLFKLVANNNSEILVAMKNLNAPGKDDAGWVYTFYSVCEIKKKSGSWIPHGHKGKSPGFGYNAVGQMKVSSSFYPDLTVQDSTDQFTVREAVLCSVDHRQEGQESPESEVNKELAAIIVKVPVGKSDNHGFQINEGKELVGKGISSTTVILPGGVHSLPNKGVPSPLIERWKSGGSCDCGGWDVGCKLRILTNEDQSCNLQGPSISSSSPDQFDLFNQGGEGDDRPIFSLEPFEKEIYSVQFNTSISLLQAFSICVAHISNQKSFDFTEVNRPFGEELFQERVSAKHDRMKTTTQYVPPPPLSPVGRA